MMVVVVETWKRRWIKGGSLQPPYNQGVMDSVMGLHILGCTQVVTSSPVFTRLLAKLQLQQEH